MSSSNSNTAIFFANPPDLNELCALTVEIQETNEDRNQLGPPLSQHGQPQMSSQSGQNTPRSSGSQPQIIRCRELIFTEPDIIGAPSLNHEKKLHLVLKQSLYKTGRLQARFQKMGLKAEKPVRVTPVLFNSCLRYTAEARLAPSWNRVGQYLVQGRDFLSSRQSLNAIRMELTANERELYLSAEVKNIKLLPMRLDDLEIPQNVRDRFASDPNEVIPEYSIENNWCYVLPSMKKGKVINICHKLPQSGPFRSYRDIKRHWKNTYGYRLPEDEDGMIYYQIYFKLIGECLFTYPECCVRPRDIHTYPRTDPKPSLQAFLSDLQNKITNICGQKFHFQTKASFLVTSLNEISKDRTSRSNLTARMPMPAAGYRHDPPAVPTFHPTQTSTSITSSSKADGHEVGNRQKPGQLSGDGESIVEKCLPHTTQNQTGKGTGAVSVSQAGMNASATSSVNVRPRIVPVFSSVKPVCSGVKAIRDDKKTLPKSVPIFRPKIPSSRQGKSEKIQPFQSYKHGVNDCPPRFDVVRQNAVAEDERRGGISHYENQVMTQHQADFGHVNSMNSLNIPIFAHKRSVPSMPGKVGKSTGMQNAATYSKPAVSGIGSHTPGSKLKLKKLPTQALPHPPQGSLQGSQYSSQAGFHSLGSSKPMKRMNAEAQKDGEGMSKAKKHRAKQTVQEGMDVTLLANNHQLHKANATTLTAWLKSRGIQCKAKDKKTDLMQKVKQALNIVSTEP